jgi:hypothetical protein
MGIESGGFEALRPLAAPLRGYPADSSGPEYRHSAALACSRPNYSAGGSGVLLALRRLSPPSRNISEFSTRRSAMAVAMVVLKRILPQSENGVFVVMMVERFWLWRVEMT